MSIFNKKIENKFIDDLLVKFFIFILFFMPIIALIWISLKYPYKEVLICNSNKCSLEQHFLVSNSIITNMNRPNVTVHYTGTPKISSYSLMTSEYNRLFNSTYYIQYFAYRDKDLIESSEKIKITKYNQEISILIFFNIILIIVLIYGRINYLKSIKNLNYTNINI